MVRSPARTAPAESARPTLFSWGWVLGGAAAILTWLGWLDLAPVFVFPRVAPAGVFNKVLGADVSAVVGWAVLVAALAATAAAYAVAATRGPFRGSPSTGALFGVALWLVTGGILMPLMGRAAAAVSSAPSMPGMAASAAADPMRGTFMMLHLGPLAPVSALIAWLLFGAILGVTASRLRRAGT